MEKFAFSVVLEPQPEGGFTVTVPALPEVVTEGGSRRIRARRERLLPPLRALLPRYRMASPFRAKDAAWIRSLLARKPTKVAAVALANKTARIVYARPNPWIGQAQVNAGKVLRYNWTSAGCRIPPDQASPFRSALASTKSGASKPSQNQL